MGAIEIPLVRFLRALPRPAAREFANSTPEVEEFPPLERVPTISLVTPSYQQGRFLEWTMRSVLEQNYPKLEYVVMDGGSTDDTRAILASYADRLTHVESVPDRDKPTP